MPRFDKYFRQKVFTMAEYYVYKLIDPRTDLPFYVGKGKDDRAYTHLTKKSKTCNPRKDKTINEIYSCDLEPIVDIFLTNLDEETAYKIEEGVILNLGRQGIDENGILTNISLHSQPPSQKGKKRIFTEEHKKKLSKALTGKPKNYQTWQKGLTKETDERIAQMAEKRSQIGNPHQIGMKYSQERIEKVKNKLRGRIVPHEQREKMSAAKKGKSWEEIFGKEGAEQRRQNSLKSGNHPNSKKINTPDGIFSSVAEASIHFNVSDYSIRQRCKSDKERWKDWQYV
jgi:hypothetical protein